MRWSMLHHSEMPNLVLVVFDLGHMYRRYMNEMLRCHKDLLMALQQCEQNAKLCQVFAFSKDFVQRLYS